MTGLFDHALQNVLESESPLAARLRPRSFAEFVGQVHIIGAGDLPPAADCGARLARGAPPVELGRFGLPAGVDAQTLAPLLDRRIALKQRSAN